MVDSQTACEDAQQPYLEVSRYADDAEADAVAGRLRRALSGLEAH